VRESRASPSDDSAHFSASPTCLSFAMKLVPYTRCPLPVFVKTGPSAHHLPSMLSDGRPSDALRNHDGQHFAPAAASRLLPVIRREPYAGTKVLHMDVCPGDGCSVPGLGGAYLQHTHANVARRGLCAADARGRLLSFAFATFAFFVKPTPVLSPGSQQIKCKTICRSSAFRRAPNA